MESVFIGTEAVTAGRVTKYQLRAHFQRVFPDVYAPRERQLSLQDRAVAAYLWSRRRAVLTGVAASALHGARWVDERIAIELNYPNNKSPRGIVSRDDKLLDDEVRTLRALPVTTWERTALDLARRGGVGQAVARLDALANAMRPNSIRTNATRFKVDDVLELLPRHPNLSGSRRVPDVLDLVDDGAESPKETWLRLLLIEAGFPRPQTQIPVPGSDGRPRYYLDMGWEDLRVAVECDGEHHRNDRPSYTKDIIRIEYIQSLRWIVIRVVAGMRRSEIIDRVRRARASRQNSER